VISASGIPISGQPFVLDVQSPLSGAALDPVIMSRANSFDIQGIVTSTACLTLMFQTDEAALAAMKQALSGEALPGAPPSLARQFTSSTKFAFTEQFDRQEAPVLHWHPFCNQCCSSGVCL